MRETRFHGLMISLYGLMISVALIAVVLSFLLNQDQQSRYNEAVIENTNNIKFSRYLAIEKASCLGSDAGCNWLLIGVYEPGQLSKVMNGKKQSNNFAILGKKILISDTKSDLFWQVDKDKGFSLWMALDPETSKAGLTRYRRMNPLVYGLPYDYTLRLTQKEFEKLAKE